jgi:hypothetical protein
MAMTICFAIPARSAEIVGGAFAAALSFCSALLSAGDGACRERAIAALSAGDGAAAGGAAACAGDKSDIIFSRIFMNVSYL